MSSHDFIALGKRTIKMEGSAVFELESRVDQAFANACELMLSCKGRVVVTGIGKSGHIANKIAATLASTGTPALFVHPGEASHGDLGMITPNDIVIAISNSGSTSEIVTLLPILKRFSVPLISLTGNKSSAIARASDAHLDVSVEQEACPLDLAPTSSTTVALVMGDALAVALLEARGFTAEDFALAHPGGNLGKKLILRVSDLMREGDAIPTVSVDTYLPQALEEMTRKSLGMTLVIGDNGKLAGIFTDGDLRRTFDTEDNIRQLTMANVMSTNPRTIKGDALAVKGLSLMESLKITSLVVTNNDEDVIGVLHMHELLHTGLTA